MGYFDLSRKIVYRDDGSIAYATGFGTVTTMSPNNNKSIQLEEARREIQQEDTQRHNWKR